MSTRREVRRILRPGDIVRPAEIDGPFVVLEGDAEISWFTEEQEVIDVEERPRALGA